MYLVYQPIICQHLATIVLEAACIDAEARLQFSVIVCFWVSQKQAVDNMLNTPVTYIG